MSASIPSPFDRTQVIEYLGGDEALFKQIALAFIAEWPQRKDNLENALAAGAGDRLRTAAHAIKGAVGHFAAERAFESARRLEASCRAGDLGKAPTEVAAVLRDVGEVLAALRAELDRAN